MGHGAPRPPAARTSAPIGALDIIERLEDAGRTLLALPHTGWTTKLAAMRWDIVRDAHTSYAPETTRLRLPIPGAAAITRMDEAFAWFQLIPDDRYLLRRILGARALVHPITGKHLTPWKRLATLLGADHRAIRKWHADGIALIAGGLAR